MSGFRVSNESWETQTFIHNNHQSYQKSLYKLPSPKTAAIKVLHSIHQQKLSSGHRTGKVQFSFQLERKEMPKNVQTTRQLHSPHTLVE